MDLHPHTTLLATLLGTWRGLGHGSYPTISDFDYADEWTFSHFGKPYLAFVQRTQSPTGAPMHTESGYLRALVDGTLEIIAALPTGQTESGVGTMRSDQTGALELATDARVVTSPSGKQVDRIARVFRVDGDVLTVELAMAAVGLDLTPHLVSRLERVSTHSAIDVLAGEPGPRC